MSKKLVCLLILGMLIIASGCSADPGSNTNKINQNAEGAVALNSDITASVSSSLSSDTNSTASSDVSSTHTEANVSPSKDSSTSTSANSSRSEAETNNPVTTTQEEKKVVAIDTTNMKHIIIRKYTSTAAAPAGQKDITDANTINAIMQVLISAPKSQQTDYDNAPGTLFNVTCPETGFSATLYREYVLFLGGKYYQLDKAIYDQLLTLYSGAQNPSTNIQ